MDINGGSVEHGGLSRRAMLSGALVAAGAAVTGCKRSTGSSPVATSSPTPQRLSVDELTSTTPYFLGSRGGARDWPEMTMLAYEQAARIPQIKAMEIAVCGTVDGVLVCSSDPTTGRVTGQDMTIANQTWATISTLRVRADETKDPSQAAQPFARLEDVLERFSDRFVFFVEPANKQGIPNLLAALLAVGHPERIVWKQPINGKRFAEARRHGFATWGYVLDEQAHTGDNLRRYAASQDIDMLGVALSRRRALIDQVLEVAAQNLKQPIAYNVQNRGDLERAITLGFRGIGTAAIRELSTMRR